MAERIAVSTFLTFSTLVFVVSNLPASVCFLWILLLYVLAAEVRVVANSIGDSFQLTCQLPTINSEAFFIALSTSAFLVSTSASAVEIRPLHSIIAFSASRALAAEVSTFLRFDSSALRKFLTSVSCASPSLTFAFSSSNDLFADASSEARADRVMSSGFSIPQALQASSVFCVALATVLSSLNALRSRSYDIDSDLISASSLTFASTKFLCSFSASSYALFNPPTRAARSFSWGSANLISWRHTGQMSPTFSFVLKVEANLFTVSLCLSRSSLRTSILILASWIGASISADFLFFSSSATLRSARFLRFSSYWDLTDVSVSIRSFAAVIFPNKSLALSRFSRNSGRLRAATVSSFAFTSDSSLSKAHFAFLASSLAFSDTGVSSSVSFLFSVSIAVRLFLIATHPSSMAFR